MDEMQMQWLLYEVSMVSGETLTIHCLKVGEFAVPIPHSEAAGQDALYCPSLEGCEDGRRGLVSSASAGRTWAFLARQVVWRVHERPSVMCTPRNLEFFDSLHSC